MDFLTPAFIGNIFGTIASLIFIFSALFKSKKFILYFHTLAHGFFIVSELIGNLYASVVQEVVSILRNITILTKKNSKKLNILFIALALIIGIAVNIITKKVNTNWYGSLSGYLGVIANVQFSIVVLFSNSIKKVKLSQGLSGVLWGFNFLLSTPSLIMPAILNFISCVTTLISLFFIKDKKINKEVDK